MAKLSDLPLGSVVYDPSWNWQFRTGANYNVVVGVTKPVEWVVVAKNHYGMGQDHVTLIAKEAIGKYCFDNSGYQNLGNNEWRNSGKAENAVGVRGFLNGSSFMDGWGYNYNPSFYDSLGEKFRNSLLLTTVPNKSRYKDDYTTQDFVFLPSRTELGDTQQFTSEPAARQYADIIGTAFEYFISGSATTRRRALAGQYLKYGTRSPHNNIGSGSNNLAVEANGAFGTSGYISANQTNDREQGVVPVVNMVASVGVTQVGSVYEITYNNSPTISGTDQNLGDKNTGFSLTYSVDDGDADDILIVKEKINGITIKTRNNPPRNEQFTITVTDEMLFSYPLHATNTVEIEVDDNQGHVVYRRYTFKRTNTAPKISGTDSSLGEKIEGFDITFSATDQENDTMSAKIFINDKLAETYPNLVSAEEYTYTISKLDFVQLGNTEEHKIRIEVQDHNNATSIRNYTFTRKVARIFYSFEKETDAMATQVLISPTWEIAEGAEAEVLVCNNAFDVEPTWEDATEQVLLERHFNFINTTKTGATWGVGVKIIINKGTATELSYLAGFGGAYK